MAIERTDVLEMLQDEGIDELVQPFVQRVVEQLEDPKLKGKSWQAWEGYYADRQDGSQNLYVMGILQHHRIFYSRCMRVRKVPRAQQTEVQKGLSDMMMEYMDKLVNELERIIKPGSGKTDQFPSGLN